VLVVEDDPSVRQLTTLLLQGAGFRTQAVETGPAAIEAVAVREPDLVLLDLMLPIVDGFEVCRQIRSRTQVPIVMLTARSDVADVVAGLELGADDYITKPFEAPELLARARAVLRRRTVETDEPILRAGELLIDTAAFRVEMRGDAVDLSATEFRLLVELVQHAGQVLTREILLERVWGYDYLGDSRLVDMAITRLREKLGDDARDPTFVTTVRGVGYRFERQ
jgi:two-component system response regulator MtrA